jgi:hypothetical protein
LLEFEASSTLHPVHGKATNLVGYLEANFADGTLVTEPPPKMHVEFQVERLRSGNSLQDREMWKLIDSRRFPLIAADLREVKPNGTSGSYSATGDITLAGRQRRYDGALSITPNGESVAVEGELVLDIRDFGLQPPRLLMVKVQPEVTVRLKLVATKQK